MKKLGLYFHIPFCTGKCGYCSFISTPDFSKMPDYHKNILKNIVLYSTQFKNYTVDSIYFGGGTPSVYFEGGIGSIMKAAREYFRVSRDCEITAEANPESFSARKAEEWSDLGVNRVSLGLQSAEPALLKAIGRRHTAEDFFAACGNAASVGIKNISADIMLGLPGQTAVDVENALKVLYKTPFLRHLSVYAFKLEKGTALYESYRGGKTQSCRAGDAENSCAEDAENRRGGKNQSCRAGDAENCRGGDTENCCGGDAEKYRGGDEAQEKHGGPAAELPDGDAAADMYDAAHKLLKAYGFMRYEVSNFAFPGFECRHNLKYWDLDEYLGIGASAHSYYGGNRYAFPDSIDAFAGGERPVLTAPDADGERTEYVMLKLRLEKGINLDEFEKRFGTRLETGASADFLIKHGLIGVSDGRLYILPDKFYVMNSVIVKLLS